MDLHELSFLNKEKSFGIIKTLIAGKESKVCQVLDSRLESNNEASKKLKKLQRIDRFLFEERGSNDLHIGWPFLRGKFSDGTPIRCPLLFFPVALAQENNQWIISLREDAGITFNKSFLLAYAFYNKVAIDEDLLETNFEDYAKDPTAFLTEVYERIKDKLEINFNADNFTGELISFQQFKKDEFEEVQKNGEIKLYPEAVLGIFPQAGSQLVPDYLHLIEQDSIRDLEDFFLRKNHDEESPLVQSQIINQPIKEEKLFAPFMMDAFQEGAIKAIKNGHSLVVQGPPGTGKSQLICNLIADTIASGKRVLLVCQKRAALDVVYERLKQADLADFLGLVHDFQNDRKEIFSKLARQLSRIEDYQARNRSVDVIQMERRFFHACRRIDAITEELDEFKEALYDDKECGLSVKELYLTSNLHDDVINIKQEYQYFNFGALQEFSRRLKMYSNYASQFEGGEYLWRNRKSFAGYQLADLKKIENTISDIPHYQTTLADAIEKLIPTRLNLEDATAFLFRESDVLGMLSVLKDEDTYRYFQAMVSEMEDETSMLWFTNTERVIINCFQGEGPETTLATEQLGHVQLILHERMEAESNFISRLRWKLFSKHKFELNRLLLANSLGHDKIGLELLEKRIDNRLNLEHHLTAVRKKSWLIDLPSIYNEDRYKEWFVNQKLAIRAKLNFGILREVKGAVHVAKYSRTEFIKLFKDLLAIVYHIPSKQMDWQVYLTSFQIRQLILNPSLEKEFSDTLSKDFDNLFEFDKLKENLMQHEKDVISKLYDHVGEWDGGKIEKLFQNSLRLTWIDHIETKYPILRSVSSMKMEEVQSELRLYVEEKQQLSKEILLLRAYEKVYENIEYNRLNNRVTYRDLQHQVTKKKKIWPLRKVITEYQEEVFRLMPCWMASPESVSAIFPMTELFDLVIFDEASQCFSERGVPAMYRGKQLLVAGDNKQLRPNELYQVRWDEDGDHPDQEVDSLLALTERYLSTVHLQGHYRSKSLELIDFSNQHFYEGRLRLLPDRNAINLQQPAIEYYKVDGVWEDHTNEAEAHAVVERVLNLVQTNPEKEIGIVTFNAPQQIRILDLLEERFGLVEVAIPPSLFVKNIENVQGDERDIIIFSVGYAPDKNKKMMMQFGSLNTAGGENRLNVAVTRAREKIILICSILPEQLVVDTIKNDGPKLLRKYLEFALRVHERKYKPEIYRDVNQSTTWYLNNHIKQWGERMFPEMVFEPDTLPFTDLNFKTEQYYQGLILTDDLRYYTSLSAKEIHAYIPALLTQKNWRHRMVFSRNFWQSREKLEDELMRFVGSLKQ